MAWYKKLHWQILIGLLLGVLYGIIAAQFRWATFTENWIAPWGIIFVNLLKLVGVPLVLVSLITGVASLSDTKKLTRMGGKTLFIYIATTAVAVTIGLIVVNILNPGERIPDEIKATLKATYQSDADSNKGRALETRQRGPLQPIVDMVPDNFFKSASENRNMLQIVFVSLCLGVALIRLPQQQSEPVLNIFRSLNAMVIEFVHLIMMIAPVGVFALMAHVITSLAGDNLTQLWNLLGALGFYCFTVIFGLFLHMTLVYIGMIRFITPLTLKHFMISIAPAQLLAFSTSSSGATLPVTMECCEQKLGVSEEVSSFVLPLGATINMDGTALYQAVAAVFIAGATGISLDLGAQITIVLTAVLASIGTAAVPGAGIIMLVIILEAISVPSEGIALILGVDRILDMLRTTCNVTGDATVATVIAQSENQLNVPETSPSNL